MSERSPVVPAVLGVVGVALLLAALALGFAAVEPPGYPNSADTPCGRVFLFPQRWGTCGDRMARQTAWVIGLGAPGALALLVPPTMRTSRAVRRRGLGLVLVGAAFGYGVVAAAVHFARGPTPLFGASAGAIVFPGFYLAVLGWEGVGVRGERESGARTLL